MTNPSGDLPRSLYNILTDYGSYGACDDCQRPGTVVALSPTGPLVVVCHVCRTQWAWKLLESGDVDVEGSPVVAEAASYRMTSGAVPAWVEEPLRRQRAELERLPGIRIRITPRPGDEAQ